MIKVVELFAGVGGFRVGLEGTECFEVTWANQWEPSKKAQEAFECYIEHYGKHANHVNKDIDSITKKEIKNLDADLIVGGFPCQDYSVARSLSGEKGIQGKKGVLFWEIERFLNIQRPKYVLLENVDRLLKSPSSQRGRDFAVMLTTFRDLGYSVEWRVINAAEYSEPQRRRRVFIFAYKDDTGYSIKTNDIDEKQMLHERGFFAPVFPVQGKPSKKHTAKYIDMNDHILDVSDYFTAQFWNSGIMRKGKIYTAQLLPIEQYQTPLRSILEDNVDNKYYLSKKEIEKFKYLKGAKKINRTAASGYQYTFSEGGMAFPESFDKPGRTMLTSEGTINRSTHVVEDTKGYRFLTPIECERLNGFPDNWTNTGMSERMRYFCMGNAL